LLTITPLLSLGADQEEKLSLRAKHTAGTVFAVHLDEVQLLLDQQVLINNLKIIPQDGHTTILLFSSPQAILNKKFLWKEFIEWLIVNDHLSLVCLDEIDSPLPTLGLRLCFYRMNQTLLTVWHFAHHLLVLV
jgi:hypothetical protein